MLQAMNVQKNLRARLGGRVKITARFSFAALIFSTLTFISAGCFNGDSNGNTATGGKPATGGKTATGGTATTGGTTATGGATNTGGASSSNGGTSNTGGMSLSGGMVSTGGSATGGTTTSGGATGSGGSAGGVSGNAYHTSGWIPASGDIWVAADGDDAAAGTESAPLKSLTTAIGKAAGKVIWMKPGNYSFSATIMLNATGVRISGVTSGPKPMLDFSGVPDGTSSRGFNVSGSKNHLRYLDIKNSYDDDNCIYVTGSGNTFEWLDIHDCGDTGLQISKNGADNTVINCDSYLNFDNAKNGENADGFAVKDFPGGGNKFLGCRAFNNSDDGWDNFEGLNFPLTFENCWAFEMKHPKTTAASDGNGFKLGGLRPAPGVTDLTVYKTREDYLKAMTADHKLTRCFAFDNPAVGFDRNNNPSTNITCTNCGAWGNGKETFEAGIIHTGDITLTVTAAQAKAAKRDANGNLPSIEKL